MGEWHITGEMGDSKARSAKPPCSTHGTTRSDLLGDSVRCESKVPNSVPGPEWSTIRGTGRRPALSEMKFSAPIVVEGATVIEGSPSRSSGSSVGQVSILSRGASTAIVSALSAPPRAKSEKERCRSSTSLPLLAASCSMAETEHCTASKTVMFLSMSWRSSLTTSSKARILSSACAMDADPGRCSGTGLGDSAITFGAGIGGKPTPPATSPGTAAA